MADTPSNNFTVNREVRPNPDPSALTTDQILRENTWLRILLESNIGGSEKALVSRLDAMDKALELLQALANRSPSIAEVDLKVTDLQRLNEETFRSIDKQFDAVTLLANQVTTSSKEAITFALQAQKESAAKSEENLDKRILQAAEQTKTAMAVRDQRMDGHDDRLRTINDKVNLIEGKSSGFASMWAVIIGAIGVIGTIIFIFVAINKGG